MMRHPRSILATACLATGILAILAAGVARAETILVGPIDFDVSADLSTNFYQFPGYTFAHSSGAGAGGVAGRASMTGNKFASSCVYDTIPNDTWGPDNAFRNVIVDVDLAFTNEVFASSETPSWQKFGVTFNVDQNRESTGTSPDSLILSFENASHLEGGSDTVYLSRGTARTCDLGTTLYSHALRGDAIVLTPSGAPNYLHLKLTLLNNEDNTALDMSVLLSDPANGNAVIASWTLPDLDYATELLGATSQGEIGVIAQNENNRADLIASKNSLKWDNFTITAVPEPASLTLVVLGLTVLLGRRLRRSAN